ncbi:MAG: redoxin domain-containing protein [Candidatus Latescibacteria bacterium]|nr:redoxin domain-containing protein [Candidatus Latescibacterota bacterium]
MPAKTTIIIVLGLILFIALIVTLPFALKYHSRITIHNFVANDMRGNEVKFEEFKDKVLLIVNTATECGLTPQFLQLQEIYKKYKDRGFVIIAFPSDSFKQEPRNTKEIVTYCNDNFLVDFPIFEKIDIKGDFQASIYKFLTEEKTNPEFHGIIKWNFEKFLIGKKGEVLARFDPETTPDDPVITNSVEEALAQ